MINRKQKIFLLMCLYILVNIPVALCAQSTIHVAGDGTGTIIAMEKTTRCRLTRHLNMQQVIQVQQFTSKGHMFMI